MESWEEEFINITQGMENHRTDAEINRVIWRINEASMYLSRAIQYRYFGIDYALSSDLNELLAPIGILCAQLSRHLQTLEMEFVDKAEETNQEYCLECIENDVLDNWGDHEVDDL